MASSGRLRKILPGLAWPGLSALAAAAIAAWTPALSAAEVQPEALAPSGPRDHPISAVDPHPCAAATER